MQMRPIAAGLASLGRGDDKMLVHMTPGEVAGLQTLAMKHGGSLTINPHTGLPEAGFLSSILPTIAGVALNAAFPGSGLLIGAGIGGLTALTSGSLKKGLLAGLGAYGGAGLGGALSNFGSQVIQDEAAKALMQGAGDIGSNAFPLGAGTAGMPFQGAAAALPEMGDIGSNAFPLPEMSSIPSIPTSASYLPTPAEIDAARAAAIKDVGVLDKMKRGLGYFAEEPVDAFSKFVGTKAEKDKPATGLGGGVKAALTAGAAAAPLLGYGMERVNEAERRRFDAARQAGLGGYAPTYPQFTFRPGEYDYGTGLYSGRGFAMAQGGTVPNLGQTYPQSNIDRATYATNPQTPQAVEVLDEYGPRMNPFTMEQKMASGGVAALHEYKAGGRLLDGPGDGMSDDIPAVIKGPSPQRAALADGEFVVPADVVSHLGNGSTKAGAKRLYAMMDKVRMARVGTKKQGKQIKAERFLPA